MSELIVDKDATSKSRSVERTVLLGYLVATSLAYIVFQVASMIWSGDIISRFRLGIAGVLLAIALIPLWIAVAIPFAVVRKLSGSRGFSSPWRATFWGSVTGLLTLPFGVEMSRIFDFEGSYPPFGTDLTRTIEYHWPFYALAGAIAGLVYWAIEFSSGPSRLIALISDTRPIYRTKGRISRRVGAAIAGIAVLGILLPIARWWWSPHISTSPSTRVEVTFIREWPTKGWVGFVGWSQYPSRLTSLSGGVIAVQNERGRPEWEKKFPNIKAWDAATNDREIVVPDDSNSLAAFSAIDLKTGEVLHQEADPTPGAGGLVGTAVKLAMSPDGSRLAVAYGTPRPGQPVSLYDTHDWHRLSTMEAVPQGQLGSQAIAFSNDGRLLAFDTGRDLVIADAQSGRTLHSIAVSAISVAFSPGSDMAAVETAGSVRSIEVFRIADGVKLAFHPTDASLGSRALIWDSLGRFIGFINGADTIGLWDPSTADGSNVTLHVRPSPGYLAISSDARCLAVANGDFISLFQLAGQVGSTKDNQACS